MRQDLAEAKQMVWDGIRNHLCDAEKYGSSAASMMTNDGTRGVGLVSPEFEAHYYGRMAGHAAIVALGLMKIKSA